MERMTMRNADGMAFWVDHQCPGGGYRMTDDKKGQERLDRLAAYEDTGLEPEEVAELVSPKTVEIAKLLEKMYEEGSAQHMLELFQAEKDGRLVVLPPVPDVDSASKENLDIFELFLAIKWANAATLMDKNPEVSRFFHWSEIALKEKLECLVNGQSSGPLTREEAEAALKKRED